MRKMFYFFKTKYEIKNELKNCEELPSHKQRNDI